MKNRIIALVCVSALAAPVAIIAADSSSADSSQNSKDRDVVSYHGLQADKLKEANHLIGMEITDDQGQKIGKVKDLALDLQNGRVVEVIVGKGGVMGMDEKYVAVPPSMFTCDDSKKVLQLKAGKDTLMNSPEIQWSHWKEATDAGQVSSVYHQYGVRPYFSTPGDVTTSSMNNGDSTVANSVSQASQNNRGHESTATGFTSSQTSTGNNNTNDTTVVSSDVRNNQGHESDATGSNNGQNTVNTATTSTTDNTVVASGNTSTVDENYRGRTWANGENRDRAHYRPITLGYITRASKVLDTTAVNDQNEKLGKVQNLVIDLPAGRVVEVIIATGGFMGIDAELSAVPPQSFQYNSDNETLTLNTTRDALKSAPHFKASEWRNANDPNNISQVYSSYHVQGYFNSSDADNEQNVRYQAQGLTPIDQGNSKGDINLTAQIRKAILADQSMSVNARNVKVITINGKVTLRGQVNNPDEKRMVEDAARKIAGTDQVDDQLQIGTTSYGTSYNSGSTTNLNEPTR